MGRSMTEEPSQPGERRWYYEVCGVNLVDYVKRIFTHLDLLTTILFVGPRRVLEVGCGTASHSCFLSYFGVRCFSSDKNPGAMAAAAITKRRFGGRNPVVRGDAFQLPFADHTFDACFSSGVMEHFSDEEICLLLSEQLRVARRVVFSVPSDHYPLREWGDERQLNPHQWMHILTSCTSPLGATVQARYQRLDLKRVKDILVERRLVGPRFVLATTERTESLS